MKKIPIQKGFKGFVLIMNTGVTFSPPGGVDRVCDIR